MRLGLAGFSLLADPASLATESASIATDPPSIATDPASLATDPASKPADPACLATDPTLLSDSVGLALAETPGGCFNFGFALRVLLHLVLSVGLEESPAPVSESSLISDVRHIGHSW